MAENRFELPTDHLATTDKQGNRVYLYPADVHGRYRTRKLSLQWVLVVLFLAMPWLRIQGRPAMLFDIPHRRFSILGLTFWAHDGPMMLFVLGGAALTLLLVTAIWGRVWCGWACPQTVFVDGLFRWIERKVEGDALARRKLDSGPRSVEWVQKKGMKWGIFFFASLVLSHSFLAYFVGIDGLHQMMGSSPTENPSAFIFMALMTGLVLFDFGWFREQFCTIACPYGRLQSVLMDEHSQAVLYDEKRGEPRRGSDAATAAGRVGDCVNCYRCVQVCPTGVDIRRGVQMECVACSACIDACDEVMVRLKKPKGLIRYDSGLGMQGVRNGAVRVRTVIYLGILGIFFSGLVYKVATRQMLDAVVMRAVDVPYQVVGDEVINHFKVDLANQGFDTLRVHFSSEDPSQTIVIANGVEMDLEGGHAKRVEFFLRFPRNKIRSGHGHGELKILAHDERNPNLVEAREVEVSLVGPFN